MCIFEIPSLLLYTHIPLLISGLFLGAFVFLSDKNNPTNKNISLFILAFCIWIVLDTFQWFITDPEYSLFIQRLLVLQTAAVIFLIYFSYYFLGEKLSFIKKAFFVIPFIPTFLFVFTDFNLRMVDFEKCDAESGPAFWYALFLVAAYLLWAIFIFWKKYTNTQLEPNEKASVKIVLFSSLFVVVWFLLFSTVVDFLISFNEGLANIISQVTPFGMLVFLGMLTYAITKYQLFNIKLIAAQALTITIWILIGSQFFFAQNTINYLLVALTLAVAIGFGIMLIRSVRLEIERKEELQKISDALAIANQRLKELDTAKSEFISIASHQLRTPLTAIKGYVSLLLEGSYGKVPASIQDVLDKIYTINSRLVQLVEDLLNISRIEAGRIQYNFAPTQIEPLVAELVDMFALTAKNKNLSLNINLHKQGLPKLTIDPNKIKEVVSNLIDNALKYTKEGSVTVSVEADERAARIIVSDTGIGIHPEDKEKLFEKFIRTKETTKMVVSGTGLGLYVGKNFVEAHGGKIWAESDGAGKGSRFIIELPFVNPKVQAGISDQVSSLGRRK